MKICIDPGHGGRDPGALANGIAEKTITLEVSLLLEWELEKRRHWAALTRREDAFVALTERADFANVRSADAFVSIHCNSSESAEAQGIEIYHFPQAAASQTLAMRVMQNLAAALPDHRNRGVKTARFVVLRDTQMASILVELEFLTHPQQAEFLRSRSGQQQLAAAIANGIGAA